MVLLVDGNNLVNAAFYVAQAKSDETNTEEVCEKTVNIFKSQIGKLQNDFSPSKIYIAWDGRNGAKWRKEVLPEYKGGRNKEGKEKLFEALDICREIDYHNNFYHEDYEADDIIYALCRAMRGEKTIISADKDFIQVIQEGLADRLFNPISKQFRVIPEICAVVNNSICGADDNLKGVPNKGPAFVKKFIKGKVSLNEQENEIFEKHKLVIGLANNPYKNDILKFVKSRLYS